MRDEAWRSRAPSRVIDKIKLPGVSGKIKICRCRKITSRNILKSAGKYPGWPALERIWKGDSFPDDVNGVPSRQ